MINANDLQYIIAEAKDVDSRASFLIWENIAGEDVDLVGYATTYNDGTTLIQELTSKGYVSGDPVVIKSNYLNKRAASKYTGEDPHFIRIQRI